MLGQTLTSNPQEKFKLQCYRSDQINEVWFKYQPLIQKALDRGSIYTIRDIYNGLRNKEMQLWTWGDEAALVTTIQNKDDKRWCLLLALGGTDMAIWKHYLPIIDNWAREKGCQELRVYGRLGWKRLGFDFEYAKLVRKL